MMTNKVIHQLRPQQPRMAVRERSSPSNSACPRSKTCSAPRSTAAPSVGLGSPTCMATRRSKLVLQKRMAEQPRALRASEQFSTSSSNRPDALVAAGPAGVPAAAAHTPRKTPASMRTGWPS
jgi:hypothetical protein